MAPKTTISLVALLSLATMTPLFTEGKSSIREVMKKMHQLNQEFFDALFHVDEQDHDAVRMNIEYNRDTNALQVSFSGIEIEGEKPDAAVNINHEKERIGIEIPTLHGKLILSISNADKLLSTQFHQEHKEEESKDKSNFYSSYVNRVQQMQTIENAIDLNALPEFSYTKEKKLLSIALHTIPEKQPLKQMVPISVQ
jgi:hypothetical protein